MAAGRWVDSQEAFCAAAGWFAGVAFAAPGRWEEPALGEWTVRDLVGHTSRALLTVETYLDRPAAEAEVASAADYFRIVLTSGGDPAAVAERGREAGAALGGHPAVSVAALVDRVPALVRAYSAEKLVATPAGGMRLGDYLPTRTFELTAHTCDLALALGQPLQVPQSAARESLTLLGELAVRGEQAATLLLAATGRRGLPEQFSLL